MGSAGRPKGTGGKAAALSSNEIRRIDKCLTGTIHELRNRVLLYLGLGTGMRISEIVGLKVKDVAPYGWALIRIVLEKHSTKGKRSRTVVISKQAQEHLRAYLKTRDISPTEPLFPSSIRPRQPITTTRAILALDKMFKEAGVANASSHSLRRTHANSLRRQGVDLKIIQEQLGHSSLAITERYFAVDPVEAQNAIERLRF